MKLVLIIVVCLLAFTLNSVNTVKKVDLNRYLGKWYQISYYPNSFQPKECGLTVAEYSLDKRGKIIVENTCYQDKGGIVIKKKAIAKAWTVDASNSKLKVRFFWPFTGDYWIVKLGENYSYSVVSDPKQKYLWILARNPVMDTATYNEITSWLDKNGWNSRKLVVTGTVN
ncbi:lipocalin family protein [Candidatus Cloacimonadaceae bacterium]